jgi:serine/threonine-protein kinase
VPPDLEAICMKALEPEQDKRHANAFEFQQDLQSYIEGSRDRERRAAQAQALVAEGKKHIVAYKEIERKRERQKKEAQNVAERIAPHDPVEGKQQLWDIEDSIAALEREASKRFSSARALFDAAIQTDPECQQARGVLADIYWDRFLEAEAQRDGRNATFYSSLVEANDSGRYATLLKGDGKLSVETFPSGAEAVLYRYVEEKRVLVPREPQSLGKTPLGPISIPMGSYLLILKAEGYRDTRYPLFIGRSESHAARITLLRGEEIGEDFIYVPAGEFLRGGDPESYGSVERSRFLVENFFIARFPVTMGEYCAFLDAVKARGEEVREHIPRQAEEVFVAMGPDGKYQPVPDTVGKEESLRLHPAGYEPRCPVFSVTWESAMAFARWRSETDGREYTLPAEDAWEKAARGVDGRFHPWGDHFDWTFTKGGLSRPEGACVEPVGAFPTDESPYGARDMVGSIREWTSSWFEERAGTRVLRGGSWNHVVSRHFRCATRFGYLPMSRSSVFGFRLFARQVLPGEEK